MTLHQLAKSILIAKNGAATTPPQKLSVEALEQLQTEHEVQRIELDLVYEAIRQLRSENDQLKSVAFWDQRNAAAKLEQNLFIMIANGASLDEMLQELCLEIEKRFGDLFCSVMLVDERSLCLTERAGPSLPKSYREGIKNVPIRESSGSCGTAAFRRELVVVEDIRRDPLWDDYRDLANSDGLVACWSTPIVDAKSRLLGTFAIYKREPDRPSPEHLQFIELATQVAIIAINKERQDTANETLQSQLRESQKLEAIGTLAGGIAHDFNNILAIILSNTELARVNMAGIPNALAEANLWEIKKASVRAMCLVNQIISFSRRQQSNLRPTQLALVAEESIRLLRAAFPARVSIYLHLSDALPMVLADPNLIEQVVINLATNSMQSMHGIAGQIDVTLDTVPVLPIQKISSESSGLNLPSQANQMVRITVADNGSGMDTAVLSRIFEPFFTTKKVGEGTGLGLSVVHGIVSSHGGSISVESKLGEGTSFTILLPTCSLNEQLEPAVPAPGPESEISKVETPNRTSKPHILIVDDDEPVLTSFKFLLEHFGYLVSDYTNSSEALEAFCVDPFEFELVLVDYNMPGLSGIEMVRKLRSMRKEMPIAITSGYIDSELRSLAEAAGVQDIIPKPCEMNDLKSIVHRLLFQ